MRYWHPLSAETAREVAEWAPDEIVCLPLYPQFSTTTTASSLAAWRIAAARHGIDLPDPGRSAAIPRDQGLVDAMAGLIRPPSKRSLVRVNRFACCSRPMVCRIGSCATVTPIQIR